MYKTLKVKIVGIAPFIMHNGQTADPLNKFARAMKEISGKKGKTEADFEELARIEYLAGLYMGEKGPVIPSVMLESVIAKGAAKAKKGKLAAAGVIVERNADLEYKGPKTADELVKDDRFRLVAAVRIGQQKVMRTRPIFRDWAATLEIKYLDDIINERDLLTALRAAGMYVGVGDWRPRNGRFALAADIAATKKAA
jgi:hypothetical protein